MPAPKKGKRFGGSAAHQKLMLANLASHLIISEAGAITTTEAKAKALRPVRREAGDEGQARRRAQAAPRRRAHPRQGRRAPAVRRDRAALRRPQRRLHAHPEARARARATTRRWRASSSSDVSSRGSRRDQQREHDLEQSEQSRQRAHVVGAHAVGRDLVAHDDRARDLGRRSASPTANNAAASISTVRTPSARYVGDLRRGGAIRRRCRPRRAFDERLARGRRSAPRSRVGEIR